MVSVSIDVSGVAEDQYVFAPSPLADLGSALHLLAEPGHHAQQAGWITAAQAQIDPDLMDRIVTADYLWRTSRSDMLLPSRPKPTLAEELAGRAHQDGHRVLWGRAVEDQGAPPLWMWRRILGAVGGSDAWGQLTEGAAAPGARSDELAAARYRAAAAAVDTIIAAADAGRLLVVLEDLH